MLPVRIPQLVNERMKNFKSVIYEQPQCYYILRVHTSLHLIRAYAIVHRKILMLNSGTTLRIFKVNVKLHRIKPKYQSLRIIAWSTDLTLICHAISQTVLSSGVDLSQ